MRSYHAAVLFYGNDHTVEENEFAHVVTASYDAGAVYGGLDLSARGTVISHNLFRNMDRRSALTPWTGPTRAAVCASSCICPACTWHPNHAAACPPKCHELCCPV